jgi:hypothetical protein
MTKLEEVRSAKSDNLKKTLLECLDKSLGIVSHACKKANTTRKTFYQYCQEDANFKSEVDDIAEKAIDFAESKLLESIKNGSDTATIFYLKTKGKKRGYVERSETELSGKTEQIIRVRVQGETEDE